VQREAALALRRKYELVHVPSPGKVERWKRRTRELMAGGYPAEQAGMEAARSVFTYEYHEHRVFNEMPVEEILGDTDA
jgi:hypothetical protein